MARKSHNVLFEKLPYLKMPEMEEADLVSIYQQANQSMYSAKSASFEILNDFSSLLALMSLRFKTEFKEISC